MTANENSARHIDTADTAKMIRAALKKAFPGVKFSVRLSRYSMGSSIRVDWLDGPTQSMVDALIGEYRGQSFDSMTDCTYGIRHWLMKDGSVQVAVSTIRITDFQPNARKAQSWLASEATTFSPAASYRRSSCDKPSPACNASSARTSWTDAR